MLGKIEHGLVDLDLHAMLHAPMLEHLFGDQAIASTDDQHLLAMAMRKDRHMAHHFRIDELIGGRDLGRPVEHEHAPEALVLKQHEALQIPLPLEHDLLRREAHAKAKLVEQGFGM